jgi:hypothetical protein
MFGVWDIDVIPTDLQVSDDWTAFAEKAQRIETSDRDVVNS